MSTHLHSLLDQMHTEGLTVSPLFAEQGVDAKPFFRALKKFGPSAICFFLEETRTLPSYRPGEPVRMPYDVCWLEWDKQSGRWWRIGVLLVNASDEPIVIAVVFGRTQGRWHFVGCGSLMRDTGAFVGAPMQHGAEEEARQAVHVTRTALQVMSCTNVELVKHEPAESLRRARQKNGRAPLFSFHTLRMRDSGASALASEGDAQGSMRLHLVRGHVKRRKTGNFWWRPFARGNKAAGVVHKDYELTRALVDQRAEQKNRGAAT